MILCGAAPCPLSSCLVPSKPPNMFHLARVQSALEGCCTLGGAPGHRQITASDAVAWHACATINGAQAALHYNLHAAAMHTCKLLQPAQRPRSIKQSARFSHRKYPRFQGCAMHSTQTNNTDPDTMMCTNPQSAQLHAPPTPTVNLREHRPIRPATKVPGSTHPTLQHGGQGSTGAPARRSGALIPGADPG
jgi:hypothetical protein